jgi:8-oxo-dGTP pyrophosphatase MutT (NUDIX family)
MFSAEVYDFIMIEYRGNTKTIVYNQAAALPFRYINDRLQIMLITSRRARRWIIPKGLLEEGLSPSELALKEAYEEAGITGNISHRSLGMYKYEKWNGICRVEVYSLFVTNILDRWPEDTFRFRQWFDFSDVAQLIENNELRQLISGFINNHQNIYV